MNIIYLDTLFLVNFFCDYILLLCTARIGGIEIRRTSIFISSMIGGLYACLCTALENQWMQSPIIQSCCSILLCVLSFGNAASLFRCTVIFLGISAMLGGILSVIAVNDHTLLFLPMNYKTTVIVFMIVYALLYIFFQKHPQYQQKDYYNITITLNGQSIECKAMRDTGNELYDPITNLPVLICEPNTLQPLFPKTHLTTDDPIQLFMELNQSKYWANRIKVIPYHTISSSGIILGFKPDSILINNIEQQYIVALAPKHFRPSDAYQAIL